MLAVQTDLKHAQTVKEYLIKHKLMNKNYVALREFNFIYFPVDPQKIPDITKIKIPRATVLDTKFSFPPKHKNPTPEELLKNTLTQQELTLLPKSQEIVGTIMILEIPTELISKEKEIAEAYLKTTKNIKTVVKKEDIHTGEFRLRKVKVLAGQNTKETIHLESGISLKLNLEKTYFSARSGNERLRISSTVKPAEDVLIMFSGAAPFPLVIAKHAKPQSITAIELNPEAHNYAVENLHLNNMESKIHCILGDVNIVLPKLKKTYHRIVMPLPKTGEEFLPLALKTIIKGGWIHLYAFLNEKEFTFYKKRIKDICNKEQSSTRIQRLVKCGQFSPGTFRVCFDIKVLSKLKS